MKRIVATFPIGVRTNPPKVGLSITPLIAQIMARKTDSRFILAANSLDSFGERKQFLKPLLSYLESMNVIPDEVWHDDDNREKLQFNVKLLIEKRFISQSHTSVLRCSCGKVEMLVGSKTHPGARLYQENNGKLICQCGTACECYTDNVLVMKFPDGIIHPLVAPNLMKKEVYDLLSRISGMEYLVSRTRSTPISVEISGKKYWVDVDFSWLTYLSLLNADQRIIVGSNHVAWHLCMSHVLSQCLGIPGFENNVLVLSPYVYSSKDFSPERAIKENGNEVDLFLPLYLLLSLAWSRKDSEWSKHYATYLKRIGRAKQLNLLQQLHVSQSSVKIDELVLRELVSSINPQNIVSTKRRSDNG
ncbi:MAG: hypothetical protein PHP62_01315 [Candidatus Moranbacteria bacterium]|nr:hypothetical protein [Candidatus Moranbacteria bacterium]